MHRRAISGEQWRTIIAAQPTSGLSIAAYCRQRRVPEASFYVWRRKLRAEASPRREAARFAEVRIAPEPSGDAIAAALPGDAIAPEPRLESSGLESSGIEVRLSNGRCVLVRAGFDRRTLLELLATLEYGVGAPAGGAASGTALHDGACGAAGPREVGR